MDPVASIIGWIAAYGVLGLFVIGLIERFVPMVPSHGLLMAIGVAAAHDPWSLPSSVVAISVGGTLGCAACFFAVRSVGNTRASQFIAGSSRFFGIKAGDVEHRLSSLRRNGTMLAFSLQLVPAARLVAPPLAALLEGQTRSFLAASAAGVTVWNCLFIGVGFFAEQAIGDTNATVLALVAVGALLAAQASLVLVARRFPVRRSLRPVRPGTV